MHSRYTKVLTAVALTGAIAVPAVAQAHGGSDDPANHEQRQHQVRTHVRLRPLCRRSLPRSISRRLSGAVPRGRPVCDR
jgi:hypothetical protein